MNIEELKEIISQDNWSKGVAIATKGIKKDIKDALTSLTIFLDEVYDNVKITQRAWHVSNDNYELQTCPICNIKVLGWQNNLSRYGEYCSNKCLANSARVKAKKELVSLDKYGVTCSFLDATQKEKRQKTIEEKYGVTHISRSEKIKEKKKFTNIQRRGYEQSLSDPDVHRKKKITNKEKYGVEYWKQRHISQENLQLLEDRDWLIEQHHHKQLPLKYIANKLGVDDSTVANRMKKFNIEVIVTASIDQVELYEFIKSLTNKEIVFNDRKAIGPYELDIYVPSHAIGIEFNGLYWHSENHKEAKYHNKKYNLTKQKHIRLIQIFEDEWQTKSNIIKNKIKHIFNINNINKVYARKTKIVELNNKIKSRFFDDNHIQGNGPSSINYGLEYNSELVACIGFIKNNDGSYNLNRYATSCNVVGGFTKLLSHFEKIYNKPKIITFADLRWSQGDLYYNTGFVMDKVLKPDYYWTKGNKRYHKFGFRHTGMKTKLENYDPNLSESENMHNHGYYKIYDAGKLRFVKNG